MRWVTRERVKVDRVACPWLIDKFVDPQAEFVFLPHDTDWKQVDGTVFDVPGAELGPHGEKVSFEAIVEKYGLDDPHFGFAQILAGISQERSTYGMVKAWELLLNKLRPFIDFHKKVPFATAPREYLGNGQFVLGFQVGDEAGYGLDGLAAPAE